MNRRTRTIKAPSPAPVRSTARHEKQAGSMSASSRRYVDRVGSRLSIAITLVSAGVCAGQTHVETDARPGEGDGVLIQDAGSVTTPDLGLSESEFEDIDLLEMEVATVVTASRREQKITAVPYAMSVTTKDDIRHCGARSIPDALRLVPGVDVADLAHGAWAVSTRGFHGFLNRQLLVLVDGRQVFDSLFGGTLWGNWPLQLEDIERIEVIRGPGGVTWGANAVNGVINIITKDPADQLGLTVSTGGGSRGTHTEHVGYAIQDGKLRLRLSGEYEASDGFKTGGSFLRSLDDEYKAGRASIHAVYDAGPNDILTLSAGNSLVDGGLPPSPLSGIDVRRNSGSQATFVLGKWTHIDSVDNLYELTGYVNDFQVSPGAPAIDYRYQQFALQFSHTFKPSDSHAITWGIDTRADLIDATNSDPHLLSRDYVSTGIIGLYVQDEWRFAPRWALDLGARMDYEFYGGFQPSARAALSHELSDNASVYAAVSRAFQMPTAGLRFVDIPILNGLAHVTADQDVDAETLIAYELGHRAKWFDRLDTNLSLFWNSYDELTTLSPALGPPGLVRMHFGNRASAAVYGVELDATLRVSNQLTLLGHYTYQQMDWSSSSPFHEKDLMSPPRHKFMVGARYSPTDDLHLSSHLFFVDAVKAPNPANPFLPRHVAPYFSLNLLAEYELWDDRAAIAVGVRNLLDDSHYEGGTLFINDAEVPRTVFARLRISFP